MKWLVRNYHWVRYAITALIAVMVVLSAFNVPGASTLAAAGLFLLIFYLVVVGRKVSTAAGEGIVEFYRDCRPEPLLNNCDQLLAGVSDTCRSPYVISLRSNRVSALRALGRHSEAEEELARLEAVLPQKKVDEETVMFRYARLNMDMDRGAFAGLEEELEEIGAMLEHTRTPSIFAGLTWTEVMERLLELSRCRLTLLADGPVPGLESRLKELIPTLPGTMYQVQGARLLGEYHMARGEYIRAKKPLTFAADKGGTTEAGRLARQALERIAAR